MSDFEGGVLKIDLTLPNPDPEPNYTMHDIYKESKKTRICTGRYKQIRVAEIAP